ncbi:MAG: hypothetical protein ACR2J8_07235, partial [Thermomicrobiales bacterium]
AMPCSAYQASSEAAVNPSMPTDWPVDGPGLRGMIDGSARPDVRGCSGVAVSLAPRRRRT